MADLVGALGGSFCPCFRSLLSGNLAEGEVGLHALGLAGVELRDNVVPRQSNVFRQGFHAICFG